MTDNKADHSTILKWQFESQDVWINTNAGKHLLGTGVAARYLAELCFIITHQEVNAILSSVFNLGDLFANTTVDDVFRGYTMTLHQLEFRLRYKETKTINKFSIL